MQAEVTHRGLEAVTLHLFLGDCSYQSLAIKAPFPCSQQFPRQHRLLSLTEHARMSMFLAPFCCHGSHLFFFHFPFFFLSEELISDPPPPILHSCDHCTSPVEAWASDTSFLKTIVKRIYSPVYLKLFSIHAKNPLTN